MSGRQRAVAFAEFSRWCWDEKGLGQTTRRKYYMRARAADEWLRSHRGSSLIWATPKDLQAYLWSTGPNARNRNNIRQALVCFGDWLVAAGYQQVNPATVLKRLKEPQSVPRALDKQQMDRILRVAQDFDPMVQALVALFAWTALRKTEVRTLRWQNILPDVSSEDVWLHFSGKGEKEREVPLHPKVRLALARWKPDCPSAEYIFPRLRGGLEGPASETWVRDRIYEVGSSAGLPGLHPHLFRHTTATRLLDTGSDIRDVQEALGHANLKSTQIYTKIRPARLREAFSRLDYTIPVLIGVGLGAVRWVSGNVSWTRSLRVLWRGVSGT